jgi:hypothetical protein
VLGGFQCQAVTRPVGTGRGSTFALALEPYCDGEIEPGTVFDRYSFGLDFDHPGEERMMSTFLAIVGRATGRFIDREWLKETRVLYRIPDGAWE